ncbi:energy transducer TonB [Pontibacter pamirensis]|uniref:energy transducer TonB n=1 Tax=Pontibacter pamirensis TaxID=2562824 RepID=UPI00138960BD|nr:energy transducer TonB [Pontibacter pamirensis]
MRKHNIFQLLYKAPLVALLLNIAACATDEEPVTINQPEAEALPPKQEDAAVEDAKVYNFVDQMPAFEGSEEKMFEFLHEHVRYPKEAREAGVEGIVVVKFIVERDGSITDVEMEKNLHPEIDQEALRVARMTDRKWKPGLQDGEPVRVQYILPMRFTIK